MRLFTDAKNISFRVAINNRLQAQSALASSGTSSVAVKYGGPVDVARHVLREAGITQACSKASSRLLHEKFLEMLPCLASTKP